MSIHNIQKIRDLRSRYLSGDLAEHHFVERMYYHGATRQEIEAELVIADVAVPMRRMGFQSYGSIGQRIVQRLSQQIPQ